MSDPLANAQLELACTVGSVSDVEDALDDGADIDFNCSSPLFVAIMAGNREVVAKLVERGADVALFELKSIGDDERVAELMRPWTSAEGPGEELRIRRRIPSMRSWCGRLTG